MLPHCKVLDPDAVFNFNLNVRRDSIMIKHESFVKLSRELNNNLHHLQVFYEFVSKSSLISLLTKNIQLWKTIAFILAIVENILILLHFKFAEKYEQLDEYKWEKYVQ